MPVALATPFAYRHHSSIEDIMTPENGVSREKLVQDLKLVIADAEDLLRATASQAGEKVVAAREKFEDSVRRTKVKLADVEEVVLDKGKQAARVTDEFVRDNPWKAVGIAAGVGLIIGMLISRR
jgi:ElaB/YqjD/DUF883 family membrane-anchored ribosome-binding protein